MRMFQNFSIKQKITAIIMFISSLVLLMAATIFVIFNSFLYKKALIEKHTILAGTICSNITAALSFNDRKAAEKTLAALHVDPMIFNAQIFQTDGQVFSSYTSKQPAPGPEYLKEVSIGRQDIVSSLNTLTKSGQHEFHNTHLDIFMPITLGGERLGVLAIQASLQSLRDQIELMITTYASIVAGLALLAYLFSKRLSGRITKPIDRLAQSMAVVSKTKDYSVRTEKKSNDELGVLIDGFNEMLVQIQKRDEALYFTQFSIDHAGVPAFWMEASGKLFYVNAAAVESLGYSKEELLRMSIGDFTPDLSEKKWNDYRLKIKQKGSVTIETVHQRKDKKVFPVEMTTNHLKFEGKEYNCAFAMDISYKKSMESKLHQAEKMKAIGSLTAGVAHDLNNILSGLVGYPELLLMDLSENDPKRKPLNTIKQSGERAAAVVQDLLTLARRGVATPQVMNLNDCLEEYLSSHVHRQLQGSNPNIKFINHFDQDLLNIFASETHLSKTIMNLTVNAAESMPTGGEVVLKTQNLYLEKDILGTELILSGEYVNLSIADTGTGISPDDIDKIFEPFYTKKKMGKSGTGLGMTVVWSSVKDANGFINVISTEGEGTCFDIYFPVCRDKITEKIEPKAIEDYLGSEKIVVVDDIPEQRELAASMLGKLGYTVTTVSSGEEAVEFMRSNPADLIVLDMIMDPGIDGLETYKRVLQIKPDQKAVIASGYSEFERILEAQRLGAGAYIKKPYHLESLGIAVRMELDA